MACMVSQKLGTAKIRADNFRDGIKTISFPRIGITYTKLPTRASRVQETYDDDLYL